MAMARTLFLPFTSMTWLGIYDFFDLINRKYNCFTFSSRVMQSLADQKPKVRYLVAVDDSKSTLKQITKAVSRKLGTGKHKVMSKEDALLNKEITVNITVSYHSRPDLNQTFN